MTRMGCILLALVAAVAQSAQALEARLDRNTIFEGESVQLIIELDRDPQGIQPDFSPLADDFFLGDTAQRSQFSLVNGQRVTRFQWSIVLEPRTAGELTIPSIAVGSEQTRPLQLSVMSRGQQGAASDVFLELAASPRDPYVHGHVQLTMKLYHVDALTEGRLIEPTLPDAVVERLGDDIAYTAEIDGTRYRVLERRFAVFPERSGAMEVPPAGFRGRVAAGGTRFNSIFDRGRRVAVRSDPIQLDVRPVPASFPAPDAWLPAASFEITESWPEAPTRFVVGEPITRNIVVEAAGLLSAQIPEIEIPEIEGMKIYPDQAQSQTRTDGAQVFSRREQGYAMVPTHAGVLELPALRVPWWNTTTNQLAWAELPARRIEIAPAADSVTAAEAGDASPQATASGHEVDAGPWRWISAILAVLWLLTLLALLRARRAVREMPTSKAPNKASAPGAAAMRSRLRAACKADDPAAAAAALLGWARLASPTPVPGLAALASRVNDPILANEIVQLDRVLYGGTGASGWTGAGLADRIQRELPLRPAPADRPDSGPVPELYPEQT